MSQGTSQGTRSRRRDAVDNRDRLLAAAREVFDDGGHDVPLDDVAQRAGVSRATLYRHFATREELVAAVFEECVVSFEARAAELGDQDDGIVELLDFILDTHHRNRSLAHVFLRSDADCIERLRTRTAAAIVPLVDRGRRDGLLRADIEVSDVMSALAMAEAALALDGATRLVAPPERVRTLVLRTVLDGV